MGMRPPPSDDGDSGPASIDFGIAALDDHLDEEGPTFPATGEEVVAALGDPEIPVDPHGHTIRLSTAVEEAAVTEYDSKRTLLDSLHPVFESHRETGLVGRLRGLLPF